MSSLQLFADFYREATFEDYSKMMDVVLPHTGVEYRKGKFKRFKSNLSLWLCDLSPSTLRKVEKYLQVTSIADWLASQDDGYPVSQLHLQYRLEGYRPDTLSAYLSVMTDEDRYAALIQNLDGIEELLSQIEAETEGVDFDSTAPASETDELT